MKRILNNLARATRVFSLTLLATACMGITAMGAGYHQSPNIYIGYGTNAYTGSTNTVPVGATNAEVSVVNSATTNVFNMPGQANTNIWPAMELDDPKSVDNFNNLFFGFTYQLMAAGTGQDTFRFASSPDATTWLSNSIVVTVTQNGTTPIIFTTNYQTLAVRFWALQEIDHTNTTAAITNLIFYPPTEKNSL